ncbi:MAG: SirA-like protein [Syntrophaceae bacterium PtaU1.Bin231]|nr:MAG: SirA-like protein [Syntrophaceae bacterium PtaU1.Bin231]
MDQSEKIDARGLACPQPVILTKKALEKADRIMVIVDDETALENVKRLGAKLGCDVQAEQAGEGTYEIRLSKSAAAKPGQGEAPRPEGGSATGPFVIVFSENRMGRGEDALGDVLVRAFIHTLCQQTVPPDKILFYNTGVKLAALDSAVVDDLKQMEAAGVELLVCGTCVNYFGLSEKIGVGVVSNMYDIADAMCSAGRLVMP